MGSLAAQNLINLLAKGKQLSNFEIRLESFQLKIQFPRCRKRLPPNLRKSPKYLPTEGKRTPYRLVQRKRNRDG